MDDPLRFCMVTTFYPPYHFGGDGVFVYRLSNELARLGHRVDVVHCRDAYYALDRGEPKGDYPQHENVRVHRLKSPWGVLSPLATYMTGRPLLKAATLRAIFDHNRYDVIHYHNISLIGGPEILRYGKAPAVKLYTTHEYWLVCPTHVLFKYQRAACVKPECFTCTLSYGRPPQWWRHTRRMNQALQSVDAFIAPSRFVIEQHRRMGLELPFVHIPHFLPKEPEVSEAVQSPSRPYFLFVGRLEKLKGVQLLISVSRDYPDADLLIVGRGRYAESLRRAAAGAPNIQFLGERSYAELKALYAGARAVMIPSLGYEVFGMVALEAFAAHTPVIVSDRGALPEIVAQSGGGIVCPTEAALREAMHALCTRADLRAELGEKGYRAYTQLWTEDQHLKAYLGLIAHLSQRKRAAASDRAMIPTR